MNYVLHYCGRIDDHPGHVWSRPLNLTERLQGLTKRTKFWCPGPPVVEGGARA